MKLTKLYGLEEASPGDPNKTFVLSKFPPPEDKLGSFPWVRDDNAGSGAADEVTFKKEIPGFFCFSGYSTDATHSKLTKRGKPTGGWMVDLEIDVKNFTYQGPKEDFFVFHIEKRFDTEEEAAAYNKKLMDFVDSKTMAELLAIPRSGKTAMSKVPF